MKKKRKNVMIGRIDFTESSTSNLLLPGSNYPSDADVALMVVSCNDVKYSVTWSHGSRKDSEIFLCRRYVQETATRNITHFCVIGKR